MNSENKIIIKYYGLMFLMALALILNSAILAVFTALAIGTQVGQISDWLKASKEEMSND